MRQKRVGIVGANGYSGQELCSLLGNHPHVEIVALSSRQFAGKTVGEVLPKLAKASKIGDTRFIFPSVSAFLEKNIDVVFLALPHGLAAEFAVPLLEAGIRVIDLSADFRVANVAVYEKFYGNKHPAPALLSKAVYGLPELQNNEERLRTAQLVACPGCYPTSILLPLIPLFLHNAVRTQGIAVSSASGLSGAGRRAEISLLFGECNNSFRAYGIPLHRHLSEIEEQLSLAADQEVIISFVPHLIPTHRGIHTTIFVTPEEGVDAARVTQIWEETYGQKSFIRMNRVFPDIKNVSMTNFCDLAVCADERAGKLLLLSAIDNLVKGASGQAVQCFNLMNGFAETEGLLP